MRYSSAAATIVVALALMLCAAPAFGADDNLLLNSGAEQGKADQPSLWDQAMVPAAELKMARDLQTAHSGNASLFIENHHVYEQSTANNWRQSLKAVPVGKTLIVKGWIKSQDVESANICLQCWDAAGKEMLGLASTPVVRGDQDWTELASDPIVIPDGTKLITVRAALGGVGKVWFDDISVSESGDIATASTSGAPDPELLKQVRGDVVDVVPVTKDQMILAYIPEWAHGRVDNIAVANNEGGVRTLLGWGEIDPKFAECRFVLACYSRDTRAGKDSSKLGAYEILEDWNEQTPWTKQPRTAANPTQEFTFEPKNGWKTFDVTTIVRAQIKAAQAVRGVMLRFETEDKKVDDRSDYGFVSREGAGQWAGKHPVLLIVK